MGRGISVVLLQPDIRGTDAGVGRPEQGISSDGRDLANSLLPFRQVLARQNTGQTVIHQLPGEHRGTFVSINNSVRGSFMGLSDNRCGDTV